MATLIILGGGTAGTMAANMLRRRLDTSWSITVIDRDDHHHYQPGYLFIPFWMDPERVVKPRGAQIHDDIDVVHAEITGVRPEERAVDLADGRSLSYDWLVVATGAQPRPDLVPGMADGSLWRDRVHEFYSLEGAKALHDALESFEGGRLLVHISEMPIKCPVAPLEFAFLVEDHLRKRGIRHLVDITFVTPLDGAFTKPVAAATFGDLLEDRSIRIAPDFAVESIDNEASTLNSYDGRALPFDLLVTVPPHTGAPFLVGSELGDPMGWIPVDKHTLRAVADERIFVLGDASDIPTSKAGSVAHFATELFVENFLAAVEGKELPESFDGHANCFLESGRGKAMLLDFNYDTEPLTGRYPVPRVGPLSLLRNTRANHLGKLAFEQIYWNVLLPGYQMPVSATMSMAGKVPAGGK